MPTEEFYAGQSNYIRKLNDLWARATTSVFGTSTDSLSVTTGSKSFTTNTNLQFAAGSQVTITATADLSKHMSGQVTSYTQDTGAIVVNVGSVNGSGTFSSWSITLSGAMGATGAAGIADNLSIGTVTSGVAAASITGTSPNKFLNLTLQTGATGAAGAPNVLSVGSVTSSGAASATITGTSPSQVLNLVLPKGDTGATGATGAKGVNPRGAWSAATAYLVDDLAYDVGSTWRRKIAGTTATAPSSDATNWEIFAQKGADGAGTVAGVTASAPLTSTGGANPNITIAQANTSTSGFLSSTDWNTFNNKQAALGYTPANKAGDTFNGNVSVTYNGASPALKVTQEGTGNAFVVEDVASDTTPFVIDASGRLILGHTSSVVIDGAAAGFQNYSVAGFQTSMRSSADAGGVAIRYTKTRGTTPTSVDTVVNGDVIADILFSATDGTSHVNGALIRAVIDAAPATGSMPARLVFSTTPTGSASPVERMRINNAGNLLVGGTTDTGEKLQVTGNAKIAGNIELSSGAPLLSFTETDQTLPEGKYRLVLQGSAISLQKNTAAAGDFSTIVAPWNTDSAGALYTITPPTASNNTKVASTEYVVARIAQDAPTKTGAGASGSWGINITGNSANVTGIVSGANGGTGIANTGKTLTLGGNHTNSGAFASTFTFTGTTTVTFPATGTLAVLGANTYTGTQSLGNNDISGIKVAGFNSEYNAGNSSTAISIVWTNGQNQRTTLTASTTITIETPPSVGHYQLRLIQDATGNRAVTWSGLSSSRWLGSATAPAINLPANSETFLNIYYDGTNITQSLAKVGAA